VYENVEAVVLSSRRVGEKDKRLVLYTREAGRLSATAVGASRPGAKLGPATEPAVEARLRLWRHPGALSARITGGAVTRSFPALRSRWERMAAAGFMCEWTERLTSPADPNPAKYDLLIRSLAHVETADPEAVRLVFMTRFLALAGYNLSRDTPGIEAIPGAKELLSVWASDDGSGPVPSLPEGFPAAHLRQQLLKFVAPLLPSPLRSAVHEEALRDYSVSARP
jgi:DNA repair protein RecO (recombination protein O)